MISIVVRWVPILICGVACAQTSPDHGIWKRIEPTYFGEPVKTMEAIAVSAKARYEGRTLDAWVLILGRQKSDGPGYVHVGVLLKGIRQVMPAADLDQFTGPDLPPAVLNGNPFALTVLRTATTKSIDTGVVFTGLPFDPGGISAHEEQYFETSIRPDSRSRGAWKAFVAEMRSGFERGRIEIGGQVLKHNLIVEFSGKGLEPLLASLMEFVGE